MQQLLASANGSLFVFVLLHLQPEMDERLQRLEGDKDSLQMQVSILIDQIEAQTDKMADLERTLSDRAFQLQKAEDNLQKVNTIVTFLTNFSFDQHSAMS
jgi:chromosome segregation ATPase